MLNLRLPKPVIAEVIIYPKQGLRFEQIIEAETGLELEIKINEQLSPTDTADIRLLRGDYQSMFLFPSSGQHRYFMNRRPSLLDNEKTIGQLKCAA